MLRQIEWWVKKWPITKDEVLPVTTLFLENFVSVEEPLLKGWFDVVTTQMSIFTLSVSAGFSLSETYYLVMSI